MRSNINFTEIFEIAGAAKMVGETDLANALYAFTAGYCFRRGWAQLERDERLKVVLLTNDEVVTSCGESYYDLFEIRLEDQQGMVIPAPLLQQVYLLAMTKRAYVDDSIEWRMSPDEFRQSKGRCNISSAELWQRAVALTSDSLLEMTKIVISDQQMVGRIARKTAEMVG